MVSTKDRWVIAARVADVTGILKSTVFKYLSDLDQVLVERIINERHCGYDVHTIKEKINALIEKPVPGKAKVPGTIHDDEGPITHPAAQMRVGFWFVRKIGSVDRAIQILKACKVALEKLE